MQAATSLNQGWGALRFFVDGNAPSETEGVMPNKEILSPNDLAEMLGYTEAGLRRMRKENRGPQCYKRGPRVFYFYEDVIAYVKHGVRRAAEVNEIDGQA